VITWETREVPLPPRAVVGLGDAAEKLVRALLRREDAELASLSGVAGKALVVIAAQSSDAQLPWAPGVEYLGVDATAPGLWVPTTLAPTLPLPLVERVLRRGAARAQGALGWLPGPPVVVVPLSKLRTLDRGTLQAWLDKRSESRV
jgi:hypothetical protein